MCLPGGDAGLLRKFLPPNAPLEETFVIARRLIAFAFACLVALALAYAPAGAQPVPYEINVILALTGPAAFIGKAEQQSLQLLEGILNKSGGIYGRPLKFVIADDASNAAVSVQLANGLIAKNIPVILGPTFTATCLSVGPLVKTGPVDYCFSPAIAPPAGSYQYSATASTHDDARAIAAYYREKGWTKIAIIATTDASGQQFAASLDDALKLPENKSMTLVAHENFTPTDLSAAALAERIKAAAPQAMVAWAAGTPDRHDSARHARCRPRHSDHDRQREYDPRATRAVRDVLTERTLLPQPPFARLRSVGTGTGACGVESLLRCVQVDRCQAELCNGTLVGSRDDRDGRSQGKSDRTARPRSSTISSSIRTIGPASMASTISPPVISAGSVSKPS